MHKSGRSRGKGGRRVSGKDGGAGKTHPNYGGKLDKTLKIRRESIYGFWLEVIPERVTKHFINHPWIFGSYFEFGSDRPDSQEYTAYLFRNKARTIFGIHEFFGKSGPMKIKPSQKWAWKIITNKAFRESLISSDPDLPKMWKGH